MSTGDIFVGTNRLMIDAGVGGLVRTFYIGDPIFGADAQMRLGDRIPVDTVAIRGPYMNPDLQW